MKSFLRPLLVACAIALAFLPPLVRAAAGPTPEVRTNRLDELVALTPEQKTKAAEVFRMEDAALDALGQGDRPAKAMEARQTSRERVRALLTPAQQKIYDRAPQVRGGGLNLPLPENKLANLDATVSLTAAQKAVALQVYQEEFESLLALSPAERPQKGMTFRRAATDQVRALLTPEQLNKLDGVRDAAIALANAEQAAIADALRASKNLAARIGSIVSVSANGSSTTAEMPNGARRGTQAVRVVGATGTESLNVSWEKASATAELRVTKVEIAGGAAIQL